MTKVNVNRSRQIRKKRCQDQMNAVSAREKRQQQEDACSKSVRFGATCCVLKGLMAGEKYGLGAEESARASGNGMRQ